MPLTIRISERGKDNFMNVFTKKWWIATGIRALKTFAEGALAVIGTQAVFVNDVD